MIPIRSPGLPEALNWTSESVMLLIMINANIKSDLAEKNGFVR